MRYAIDLNPRQAARVLEQAIRCQATIMLEPSVCGYFDALSGFVASGDRHSLMVELTDPPDHSLSDVRGLYCDVELLLVPHRYMFCSDIIDVRELGSNQTLVLARPETMQVAQRRRFWRLAVAETSTVRLSLPSRPDARPAEAVVYNISGDGMACCIDRSAAADLLIGDLVHVGFELPHCPKPFDFDAVLCNKTPASSE
ncbi:MAG: PilZ domain-containing protein, partial [Phycisphaerae bacterium]